MTGQVYLLKVTVTNPWTGVSEVIRASYPAVAPFPSDDPDEPNSCWDPTIVEPPNYVVELYSDPEEGVGGGTSGEVSVSNTASRYSRYRGWAVQTVELFVGDAGTRFFAGYDQVLSGAGGTIQVSLAANATRAVSFPLSDLRDTLDDAVPAETYAGSNTSGPAQYEGGSDLAGSAEALALGDLTGALIPAPLVNSAAELVYQPGQVFAAVTSIEDRGQATGLTLVGDLAGTAFDTAHPTSTQYVTDQARGLCRLGGAYGGTVTFGVIGDPAAGTTAPALIKWLLQRRGFTAAQIGAGFDNFGASPTLGWWTGTSQTSYRELINLLARSVAAWVVPDELGVWQLGRLALPTGNVAAGFGDSDVVSLDVGSFGYATPIYEWRIQWGKRFRTFSPEDLAGQIADAAEIQRLGEEWSTAVVSDGAVKAIWTEAESVTLETALRSQADAEALAAYLDTLFGGPRLPLSLVVPMSAASRALRVGQEVHLSYPREEIDGDFLVVGKRPAGPTFSDITFQLWGVEQP